MDVSKSLISGHKVAIVGRPNVGKSTLFNILTGTRKAVVKNVSGVTRDIQIHHAEVWGKNYQIIDTGGVTEAADTFSQLIKEQVSELLSSVDLIIAVMDGRSGLCPEDKDIIKLVKSCGKKVLLAVNKIDSPQDENILTAEFFEFGTDLVPASFEQRRGVGDILEWLQKNLPDQEVEENKGLKLAIVGKPNVGKSSLCNFLLGQKRMLVSDIAGTTVDSIDSQVHFNNEDYILIDTAGLRRPARRTDDVEIISAFKTEDSINRADIILLLVDGREGPTEQDAKILDKALKKHKGVILVANKSDLGEEEIAEYRKTFRAKTEREFHYFKDIPLTFISAKTGMGVEKLFKLIEEIREKLHFRVSTSELNDYFFEIIRKAPAPVWRAKSVKFYYLTQTHQVPPSFIAFANHPDGVNDSYKRFLAKNIKKKWDLQGIPIRIFAMKSKGN